MTASVGDFEVLGTLGPQALRRHVCRPPARLGRAGGAVLVSELEPGSGALPGLADRLESFMAVESEHLCRVLEAGLLPEDGAYVVSPAPERGTLADPSHDLDLPAQVRAVAHACLGAHALHEGGLAHGGIDAHSVLLFDQGAKLAPPPLGLPDGALMRIRRAQDLVTVHPDLLAGGQPSRSSDIWALASTLHISLSKLPLYAGIDGDSPVTAVQRVLFTRPAVDVSLPRSVAEVIRACLDPDPAGRPLTAEEMSQQLAAVVVLL